MNAPLDTQLLVSGQEQQQQHIALVPEKESSEEIQTERPSVEASETAQK